MHLCGGYKIEDRGSPLQERWPVWYHAKASWLSFEDQALIERSPPPLVRRLCMQWFDSGEEIVAKLQGKMESTVTGEDMHAAPNRPAAMPHRSIINRGTVQSPSRDPCENPQDLKVG